MTQTPLKDSETKLRQVGEDRVVPELETSGLEQAATQAVLLALKTLSQKTLVALGQLFTLLTCTSAFALWYSVLPNPNSYQLVGLALYGGFILLVLLIRRDKK